MAKDAKMENWVNLFEFKANWRLNPELPVLGPWKTTTPINTPTWVLERNPYYYAVDTAGNQLPYWDKIVMTLAENLEVINLRAIAGEYDWQERHMDLSKLRSSSRTSRRATTPSTSTCPRAARTVRCMSTRAGRAIPRS